MTEDRLDVWDCRFCIASGKNIIWNAKRNGGNPYADRKQLIQYWLTHQGICKNRKSADLAKRTSSTFSTSVVKRWAFEFMDTCVDDQGRFDKERAEVFLMERLGLENPVPTKSPMSMTEDRLDVWDCRFCIASGKNIIWNARKDGKPRHADREQLIQSWLTHQGDCENRQSADFAKRTSSTFSTSVVKRWAFEFMDICVDDQGWFDKERAEVYLMERLGLVNPVSTKSSTSSKNEDEGKQEQDGGNKKTEGADDNDMDPTKASTSSTNEEGKQEDGGNFHAYDRNNLTRSWLPHPEGGLINPQGGVWFPPCILECDEESELSNEERKAKRQCQNWHQSSTTEGDDNDIYENFVCGTPNTI